MEVRATLRFIKGLRLRSLTALSGPEACMVDSESADLHCGAGYGKDFGKDGKKGGFDKGQHGLG